MGMFLLLSTLLALMVTQTQEQKKIGTVEVSSKKLRQKNKQLFRSLTTPTIHNRSNKCVPSTSCINQLRIWYLLRCSNIESRTDCSNSICSEFLHCLRNSTTKDKGEIYITFNLSLSIWHGIGLILCLSIMYTKSRTEDDCYYLPTH